MKKKKLEVKRARIDDDFAVSPPHQSMNNNCVYVALRLNSFDKNNVRRVVSSLYTCILRRERGVVRVTSRSHFLFKLPRASIKRMQ